MTFAEIVKTTNAYKIMAGEKRNDVLSHAYLIICDDGKALRDYLKIFAKLIMCDGDEFCGECRTCRLIDKEVYPDCTFYPQEKDKILVSDIDDLVSQTYVRPLENKRRLFVLCGAENMNTSAQNKLLKTLEEPPENVVILMGATSEYPLLATIKSRVKKLEIPPIHSEILFDVLKSELTDEDRLKRAIALSGGRVGEAISSYNSGKGEELFIKCRKILNEMKTSRDVLSFVGDIDKDDISDFITAMKIEAGEIQRRIIRENVKEINGYTVGALVAIEELLDKKCDALNFNANGNMTIDRILLGILEEKHKWQQL